MGFLDEVRKSKKRNEERLEEKREWVVNRKPAAINLTDNYIDIRFWRNEIQVFYKDIRKVERTSTKVEIKTIIDEYKIGANKMDGSNMVDELHAQILSKMNSKKTPEPQTSPSFCGNCGNPLSGENFCPNCGAEVKK